MPKISAVMALYNTPFEFLTPTVKSVLAQSFQNFELIVVDDASTMDYADFFAEFMDERIKYFKLSKNAGPGHARNEGIKKSTGEFVAIVDSDDIYMPNRFEAQLKLFNENPDVSLVSGGFKFSNNGRVSEVTEDNENIKIAMLFNSPLANPLIMFRREVFIANNLFYPESINFAEDYELWINAMFCGIKMANINDVLMIYTRRKGQLSKEKAANQVHILKTLYKKILLNLGLEASEANIDLYYCITSEKFENISSIDLQSWFDDLIERNKSLNLFDENLLSQKKEYMLNRLNDSTNKLFRIKIGNYNLIILKTLKLKLQKRS